jgi:fructan beta-fructosidase
MNLLLLLSLLVAGGDDILIANFEGKDYGAWTVTGSAFGSGPAAGTLPNQMPVDGFLGKGLVNSYAGGDGSVGTLTSPPFPIERKAINFLIGGGRHPHETCMNLIVEGKVLRSATGRDSEHLDWESWDVSEFLGRRATLEIVDRHTGGWGHINVDEIVQSDRPAVGARTRTLAIERRYLHLPVRTGAPKRMLRLTLDGAVVREFEIELAERDPQFWAFVDVEAWKGKTLRLESSGPPGVQEALEAVVPADELKAVEPLYAERSRPQFHFTARHGWLNDPNGLVFYKGEYHLYFQYNPYGWGWGNMHWGHAVSQDLVHWKQLPIALAPARYGDWRFSGSAVVDAANTSGFKTGKDDVLVLAQTSTGRGECIAYSNDRGRTWTEYAGNPVVKHQGRDPRLLWHAPTKQWVMALYHEEGKSQSIAFHTSPDLKTWTYRSRIDGFYECPDLFELPVDGDASKTRWVLLAADGKYLLGAFDGSEFKPDGGKHTLWHGAFYASQTYSNVPDQRRIQIGWARGTDFPGMPFNQQMNVPVTLELKTVAEGIRMVAAPVKELETLREKKHEWSALPLKPGENPLADVSTELADVRVAFRPGSAERIVLDVRGVPLTFDARKGELSTIGAAVALKPVGGVVSLRVLVDRGSVEIFADDGAVAIAVAAVLPSERRSFALTSVGGAAEVEVLELWELRSAWK